MIGLLLVLAPFVGPFWQRDLGALHRELLENPNAEQRALFDDLLRLATCDKLEKLKEPDPLRMLVRAEEARRGAPRTIWAQLMREDFFQKTVWSPAGANVLIWPDEEERWPGEVLLVGPLKWNCAKVRNGLGPFALLTPELIRSLPPEPAARVAYERAVLNWRKGSTEGAAAVNVALLDPSLRPAARFLRLEGKVDPPQGWVALAADWPDLAVVTRASWELLRERRHEEAVELTGKFVLPQDPRRAEMVRSILWVRALALQALGRDEETLAALAQAQAVPGSARGRDAMRAVAMSTLARQPVDAALLERFSGVTGLESTYVELARRALSVGNLPAAREAAQRLQRIRDPRWRAEGLALAGEIAWVSGEADATRAALDQLFAPGWRAAEKGPRDDAAVHLAHAMVLTEAEMGGQRKELESQLRWLRDQLSARDAAQIEALLASLRETAPATGEQGVALGQVDVIRAPETPLEVHLQVELPEPRSLLAIPAEDGTLHDWFDDRGPP